MAKLVERVLLNKVLEAKVAEQLQAKSYERCEERSRAIVTVTGSGG